MTASQVQQVSKPLQSNLNRWIAERIRRAIAALKPDLMRPVSVRRDDGPDFVIIHADSAEATSFFSRNWSRNSAELCDCRLSAVRIALSAPSRAPWQNK